MRIGIGFGFVSNLGGHTGNRISILALFGQYLESKYCTGTAFEFHPFHLQEISCTIVQLESLQIGSLDASDPGRVRVH